MHSCLYEGWVRHRRLAPAPRSFRYRTLLAYLDLDELDVVFRGRWFWSTGRRAAVAFRRADYLGDPSLPLAEEVRSYVARETGSRPCGPIRMLAYLAHFGYCFNPVVFYYCFEPSADRLEAVVAEITNTPWGERHRYLLRGSRSRFAKTFHVSPFMPMDLSYDWRCNVPGDALAVHMNLARQQQKVFDATLLLKRRAITGASLAYALARYPLMTQRASLAIYWQALLLYAQGARFYPHPSRESMNEHDSLADRR